MDATGKVAVVTGSNRGIGFAFVKGLCETYDGYVYLTSRDFHKGVLACKSLNRFGYNPLFHQLDITDPTSIYEFREHIKSTHGGIDVLINNAALSLKFERFNIHPSEFIYVNYFGTVKLGNALYPLLRRDGRVINICGAGGHLLRIPSESLRLRFSSVTLDITGLNNLVEEFIRDTNDGTHEAKGWGSSAYVVSKVALHASTLIDQRGFDAEYPNRNISVNSLHPGYVDTDMWNHLGFFEVVDRTLAPLTFAIHEPYKGKYLWCNCEVVEWDKPLSNQPWIC